MLLYNVVASHPVPRPGGIEYYPSVVNPRPVDRETADGIMADYKSRGVRCRLEGAVQWAARGV